MDNPTPAPVLVAGAPPDPAPDADPVPALLRRYRGARERRRRWESLWQACYDHALPHRQSALGDAAPGVGASPTLYDGTAPDAVDQLAASMVAQLTPPWARWFDLAAGSDLDDTEKADIAPILEQTAEVLRTAFAGSNFAVEIHQCYMDLVTIGTACLAFEEAPPGEPSAFRFAAVPMADVALDEGPSGRLDTVFRSVRLSLSALRERYPGAVLPPDLEARTAREPDLDLSVLDCVVPDRRGYAYTALLLGAAEAAGVANDAHGRVGHRAGPGAVRRLALSVLSLAEGTGRGLWPLSGHEGAAGHPHRQQGRGTGAQERLHRGHRHLAGRR